MIRVVAATVVALLLVAGCGSTSSGGGGSASSAASPSASPSPSSSSGTSATTHFSQAETDAVNKVLRPTNVAQSRVLAAAPVARCNKLASKSISAWRACWHNLLDPYAQGLRGLSDELHTLQVGTFPPACIDALKSAERTLRGFAARIDKLLAGFDSSNQRARVKAITGYAPTLRQVEAGMQPTFTSMTTPCYTPEEIKRERASASASATPNS